MLRKKDNVTAYMFLLPALVIFIGLIAVPVVISFLLSFTEWSFLSGWEGLKFVNIQNYTDLFQDRYFVQAIKNTFVYAITTVPVSLILALVIAYVLNGKVYFKKIMRLCFFVPYISSAVALAAIFKVALRENGVINTMLQTMFNVQNPPSWFADSSVNKIPIIIFVIWTAIGYELIVYMAALQNISPALYEAADIDGAYGWRKFFHITFPLITPTTFYLAIVRLIAAFKIFAAVNVMALGLPARANTSMVMTIYQEAFSKYKFGYASAEAWVLFIIIFAVTLVQLWGQKKWVHY